MHNIRLNTLQRSHPIVVLTFYDNSAVLPDNRFMHNGFCVQTILPMMMCMLFVACAIMWSNHIDRSAWENCAKSCSFATWLFHCRHVPWPFLPCHTWSFLVCAKNGHVSTFWSTSPCVFLFIFLLVVFGKVRILVFISFCGTTKISTCVSLRSNSQSVFGSPHDWWPCFRFRRTNCSADSRCLGGSPSVQQSSSSFS